MKGAEMTATANAPGRRITVREASVRTATVEVRALTISGRQVTLSVFRQLLDEPLIDQSTGELMGVPWGTVNYYFGGCEPDHLHAVWQKGDELRRACVSDSRGYRGDEGDHAGHLSEAWENAAGALAARRGLDAHAAGEEVAKPGDKGMRVHGSGGQWVDLRRAAYGLESKAQGVLGMLTRYHHDHALGISEMVYLHQVPCGDPSIESGCRTMLVGATFCNHKRSATEQELDERRRDAYRRWSEELRTLLQALLGSLKMPSNAGADAIAERMGMAISEWRAFKDLRKQRDALYARHYGEVAALPQLFIAV